jgi:hypothetical protein
MTKARTKEVRSNAKISAYRLPSRSSSGQRKRLSTWKFTFLALTWILYTSICSAVTAMLIVRFDLPLTLGMLNWLFTVLFPMAYLVGPSKFLSLLKSFLQAIQLLYKRRSS